MRLACITFSSAVRSGVVQAQRIYFPSPSGRGLGWGQTKLGRTLSVLRPPCVDLQPAIGEVHRLMLCIRWERPEDISAIRGVHELAFGRPAEADLVDAL